MLVQATYALNNKPKMDTLVARWRQRSGISVSRLRSRMTVVLPFAIENGDNLGSRLLTPGRLPDQCCKQNSALYILKCPYNAHCSLYRKLRMHQTPYISASFSYYYSFLTSATEMATQHDYPNIRPAASNITSRSHRKRHYAEMG